MTQQEGGSFVYDKLAGVAFILPHVRYRYDRRSAVAVASCSCNGLFQRTSLFHGEKFPRGGRSAKTLHLCRVSVALLSPGKERMQEKQGRKRTISFERGQIRGIDSMFATIRGWLGDRTAEENDTRRTRK